MLNSCRDKTISTKMPKEERAEAYHFQNQRCDTSRLALPGRAHSRFEAQVEGSISPKRRSLAGVRYNHLQDQKDQGGNGHHVHVCSGSVLI